MENEEYNGGAKFENESLKSAENNGKKKILVIVIAVIIAVLLLLAVVIPKIFFNFDSGDVAEDVKDNKKEKYEMAQSLSHDGKYAEAIVLYSEVGEYENTINLLEDLYGNYNGYYYDEASGIGLYLEIWSVVNADVEISKAEKDKETIIASKLMTMSGVETTDILTDSNRHSGEITLTLENDSISLHVNSSSKSFLGMGECDVVFQLSSRSDMPLIPDIEDEETEEPEFEDDVLVLPMVEFTVAEQYAVSSSDGLNLRYGPGVEYEIIMNIPDKKDVYVWGFNIEGFETSFEEDWVYVNYDRVNGWVNSYFLDGYIRYLYDEDKVIYPTQMLPDPQICTVSPDIGLNLRYGPGKNYEKVVSMPYKAPVTVWGFMGEDARTSPKPEWVYVEYVGAYGWANTQYLNGFWTDQPDVEKETKEEKKEELSYPSVMHSSGQVYTVSSVDGLNLRYGPGADRGIIRNIPNNASVTVWGFNSADAWTLPTSDWVYVEYSGSYGWVNSVYLKGYEHFILYGEEDHSSVEVESPDMFTVTHDRYTVTDPQGVGLYAGPGTDRIQLTTVKQNSTVVIEGWNSTSTWAYVLYDGYYGWIEIN